MSPDRYFTFFLFLDFLSLGPRFSDVALQHNHSNGSANNVLNMTGIWVLTM